MADLNDVQAAQSVKIIGSDSSGVEQTPVKSDSNGSLHSTIVGNDGLYKAFVDSAGRISVNANVTFPEAIYKCIKTLNGSSNNGNVNGSVTPVAFRFSAPVGEIWYLEKITFVLTDNANFTNTGFGGGAALTNGVDVNIRTKGTIYNFSNTKSNYEIIRCFTDEVYSQIDTGLFNTDRIYRGSVKFQNRIVLDGNLGDYLEMNIRDNLTGMTGVFLSGLIWRVIG